MMMLHTRLANGQDLRKHLQEPRVCLVPCRLHWHGADARQHCHEPPRRLYPAQGAALTYSTVLVLLTLSSCALMVQAETNIRIDQSCRKSSISPAVRGCTFRFYIITTLLPSRGVSDFRSFLGSSFPCPNFTCDSVEFVDPGMAKPTCPLQGCLVALYRASCVARLPPDHFELAFTHIQFRLCTMLPVIEVVLYMINPVLAMDA